MNVSPIYPPVYQEEEPVLQQESLTVKASAGAGAALLLGTVGYLMTRVFTRLNPAIGFIAPATFIGVLLPTMHKINSRASKIFAIIATMCIPMAIGAVVGIPISFQASLTTITLAMTPFIIIGILKQNSQQ